MGTPNSHPLAFSQWCTSGTSHLGTNIFFSQFLLAEFLQGLLPQSHHRSQPAEQQTVNHPLHMREAQPALHKSTRSLVIWHGYNRTFQLLVGEKRKTYYWAAMQQKDSALMELTSQGCMQSLTACGDSIQQMTVLVALALLGDTSIWRNE